MITKSRKTLILSGPEIRGAYNTNSTYTQAGVWCLVGQESAKFGVQLFVVNSELRFLPACSCEPLQYI